LLWRQLGILEASTGEFSLAIEHFQNSSKIGEKLGDNIIIGDNYFEVGLILRNQGEYVQAWESFINAENSVRAINHYKTMVYSQGQRANLLAVWGRFDDAIDLLKQSLSLWEKFDVMEDRNMRHTTLHTLGRIYLQTDRVKDAKEVLLESLKLKEASGERYDSTMRTRSLLADACIALGNYSEAKEHISEASIETSIRIGSYLYAAESLRTLSRIYCFENDYIQSERLAKRSLEIAQIANNPLTQIETIIWIIQLSFLQKNFLVLFSILIPLIKAINSLKLTPVQFRNLFIQHQAVLKKSITVENKS
jgi:tetratricopeptide (TPR) repeat protein